MLTTLDEHARNRGIDTEQAAMEIIVLCEIGFMRPVSNQDGVVLYGPGFSLLRSMAAWN